MAYYNVDQRLGQVSAWCFLDDSYVNSDCTCCTARRPGKGAFGVPDYLDVFDKVVLTASAEAICLFILYSEFMTPNYDIVMVHATLVRNRDTPRTCCQGQTFDENACSTAARERFPHIHRTPTHPHAERVYG
jgi:hypothetical protein